MEFRILGPVEAIEQGRSLPLGAHKQRALLTLLLVHKGEVVSAERLIDELWGGEPPQAAAKSLQVYVSQLRKVLGGGVLETRGRGYVLEVADEQLDSQRFERLLDRGRELVAAGDPQTATATLHDALGLWRGPPLDDVRYEDFAQPEIARLEELHQAVLEERAAAELALGRHAELVPISRLSFAGIRSASVYVLSLCRPSTSPAARPKRWLSTRTGAACSARSSGWSRAGSCKTSSARS